MPDPKFSMFSGSGFRTVSRSASGTPSPGSSTVVNSPGIASEPLPLLGGFCRGGLSLSFLPMPSIWTRWPLSRQLRPSESRTLGPTWIRNHYVGLPRCKLGSVDIGRGCRTRRCRSRCCVFAVCEPLLAQCRRDGAGGSHQCLAACSALLAVKSVCGH